MRILLVVHHELSRDSGAAGSVLALAEAYEERGHAVRLLSYDDLPRRTRHRAREVVFPWFVAARLTRIVRDWRPDVIDASTGDAWLWARTTMGRGRNRPLLVTRSHGLEHSAHEQRVREARAGRLELSWKYPLYYGGVRIKEVTASLRAADAVFFLNREDHAYATERLGVPLERAHVVRNGVPRSLIGRPPPAPIDGPVRIAQVGTYIARKGVHYGAEALTSVLERHPDVCMTFLGTGCPGERVLHDFPPSLHARVDVIPSYRGDELPRLLAGHQVKLFPTLYDGLGKTLLEAMACGLAPVTTRVAGPLEVVRDGENGLLVPPADADALTAALERLLADACIRQSIRARAWESVQAFTWERAAGQRLGIYGDAVLRRDGNATRDSLPVEATTGITNA